MKEPNPPTLSVSKPPTLSCSSAPRTLAFGVIAILGLTPLMGFLMVQIPFEPVQFRYGLALFCCVPTTLTSGVTLVNGALGNGVGLF